MAYNDQNVFAKILRGELPCHKVYEDEHTLAFMDIMPQVAGHTLVIPKVAGSEDFSEFQKVVPGFFYFLGAPPRGKEFAKAPPNHSALFDIDEDQLPTGARSLAALAVDFLQRK